MSVRFPLPSARRQTAGLRRRVLLGFLMTTATVGAVAALPVNAYAAPATLSIGAGETYTLSATTTLSALTIDAGGAIVGAGGKSVTLTVDGVEKGQQYATAVATATTLIAPGTYSGTVILTLTDPVTSPFQSNTYSLRAGVVVSNGTVDRGASVPASWLSGAVNDSSANDLALRSEGAGFNGILVKNSAYDIDGLTLNADGNGRSDFAGVAAGIVGSGDNTTVTVNDTTIDSVGVARGAVTSTDGANVIVKNSKISVANGTLPEDYVSTVDLTKMMDAPWMLGINGNNRATLLLGNGSKAAYVNTDLHAEGWGVLSTDAGTGVKLSAINSTVSTGYSGYGFYAIGDADETLLGTDVDVDDYIGILTANGGGDVHIGDSTPGAVAALNTSRSIGLSAGELSALPKRSSTLTSDRIGFMWHGAGNVSIDGDTTVHTRGTVFQDKGRNSTAKIDVDGSDGTTLTSDEGVLLQTMTNDDPGPVVVDGALVNAGVYTQPTSAPTKDASWDVTNADAASATVADLTGLDLKGDFYNAAREGKNLVLNLDGTSVDGVISASTAIHKSGVTTITSANWQDIGEVTNTASAAVNNGVIVNLSGDSSWTVQGTSYLTRLSIGANASIGGADGRHVVATVDGVPTDLTAGRTYTGDIVISLADLAATSTSVSVSPRSTTAGTAATATVTVASSDATPTGEVTVSLDGVAVGSAVLDAAGTATVTLPANVPVGSHTVTATYAAGSGFAGSIGQATFDVAAAAPTSVPSADSAAVRAASAHAALATTGSDVTFGPVALASVLLIIAGGALVRRHGIRRTRE